MTTQDTESDVTDLECEPVPAWDQFFLDWGLDSLKQSTPALNDMLGKLLTLNSVLIGGGFAAAKWDALPFSCVVVAILFLILSLGASLRGLWPVGRLVDLNNPTAIKDTELVVRKRKVWCLRVALVAIAIAFGVAFIGMIAKGPPKTEEGKPPATTARPAPIPPAIP